MAVRRQSKRWDVDRSGDRSGKGGLLGRKIATLIGSPDDEVIDGRLAKNNVVPNSAAAIMIHAARSRQGLCARALAGMAAVALSAIHFTSPCRSRALCQRSSGSFARHCLTTRSSAAGVSGWVAEIGGGSSFRIEPIRLACVLPAKALLPVSIS